MYKLCISCGYYLKRNFGARCAADARLDAHRAWEVTGRRIRREYFMGDDTIKLLRECNAGIKMGLSSLDDLLEHVSDDRLRSLLLQSYNTHSRLGEDTREYLEEYHDEGKEPAAMAKMMSWVKTNMKLGGEESDRVVADLVTDGCNMGVKSLYRYLHQYPAAEERVKKLTMAVIEAEDTLVKDVRDYL